MSLSAPDIQEACLWDTFNKIVMAAVSLAPSIPRNHLKSSFELLHLLQNELVKSALQGEPSPSCVCHCMGNEEKVSSNATEDTLKTEVSVLAAKINGLLNSTLADEIHDSVVLPCNETFVKLLPPGSSCALVESNQDKDGINNQNHCNSILESTEHSMVQSPTVSKLDVDDEPATNASNVDPSMGQTLDLEVDDIDKRCVMASDLCKHADPSMVQTPVVKVDDVDKRCVMASDLCKRADPPSMVQTPVVKVVDVDKRCVMASDLCKHVDPPSMVQIATVKENVIRNTSTLTTNVNATGTCNNDFSNASTLPIRRYLEQATANQRTSTPNQVTFSTCVNKELSHYIMHSLSTTVCKITYHQYIQSGISLISISKSFGIAINVLSELFKNFNYWIHRKKLADQRNGKCKQRRTANAVTQRNKGVVKVKH